MATEEKIATSVASIEVEAGKILAEARTGASEIIRKANEEANRILTAKSSLDEAKAEYDQIVSKAREEANKQIETSKKRAAEIRGRLSSSRKTVEIIKRVVSVISGADLG